MSKSYIEIQNLLQFQNAINEYEACLMYFSHDQCNVCKVLKPKIQNLIGQKYERIKLFYCDTLLNKEIAAQHSIFTVPVIIIYFMEKEYFRFSRIVSIDEIDMKLSRIYGMVFDN